LNVRGVHRLRSFRSRFDQFEVFQALPHLRCDLAGKFPKRAVHDEGVKGTGTDHAKGHFRAETGHGGGGAVACPVNALAEFASESAQTFAVAVADVFRAPSHCRTDAATGILDSFAEGVEAVFDAEGELGEAGGDGVGDGLGGLGAGRGVDLGGFDLGGGVDGVAELVVDPVGFFFDAALEVGQVLSGVVLPRTVEMDAGDLEEEVFVADVFEDGVAGFEADGEVHGGDPFGLAQVQKPLAGGGEVGQFGQAADVFVLDAAEVAGTDEQAGADGGGVEAEFGEQVEAEDEGVEAPVGEVAVEVFGGDFREGLVGALGEDGGGFGVVAQEDGFAGFEVGGGKLAGSDLFLGLFRDFPDAGQGDGAAEVVALAEDAGGPLAVVVHPRMATSEALLVDKPVAQRNLSFLRKRLHDSC